MLGSLFLNIFSVQASGHHGFQPVPAMAFCNWDDEALPVSALQWSATNGQAAHVVASTLLMATHQQEKSSLALKQTDSQSKLNLASIPAELQPFHLDDLSPSFCKVKFKL